MVGGQSRFLIMQFTDLLFGESYLKDHKTENFMRDMVTRYRPDFIVFTGNLLSGSALREEEKEIVWRRVVGVAAMYRVPFATVFGDRDDQPYHMNPHMWQKWAIMALILVMLCLAALALRFDARSQRVKVGLGLALLPIVITLWVTASSKATRLGLVAVENQSNYSQTKAGFRDGVSNYRIVDASGVSMLFLDSGGGRLPEGIFSGQVEWVRQQPRTSLAFVHLPPADYGRVVFSRQTCSGPFPLQRPTECPHSEHVVSTLATIGVQAVFVGHDRGNAWCCGQKPLLCYGQQSGTWPRGARLISMDRETGNLLGTWVVAEQV